MLLSKVEGLMVLLVIVLVLFGGERKAVKWFTNNGSNRIKKSGSR